MTETERINWEEVAAFLQKRWQDQAGRVAVQIESSTTSATWAVEVDHPEAKRRCWFTCYKRIGQQGSHSKKEPIYTCKYLEETLLYRKA